MGNIFGNSFINLKALNSDRRGLLLLRELPAPKLRSLEPCHGKQLKHFTFEKEINVNNSHSGVIYLKQL